MVSTSTTTMLDDVVVGAIRGSSDTGAELGTARQHAVEGALRGGASVELTAEESIVQVTRGTIDGTREVGGALTDAARGAVAGVFTTVAKTPVT